MTQDATISSIKTPATIPDDMFQLRFRTKTPMTDHGRMTTYWVDTDGRRVGEEEALTAAAVDQQQAAGTDTAEEPVEYGHWVILAGSVAPLAGIAIFWCVRRRTTG